MSWSQRRDGLEGAWSRLRALAYGLTAVTDDRGSRGFDRFTSKARPNEGLRHVSGLQRGRAGTGPHDSFL